MVFVWFALGALWLTVLAGNISDKLDRIIKLLEKKEG